MVLQHIRSLTKGFRDAFLENDCTVYDQQIILFDIVPWRSSWAENVQAAHQRNQEKVRQGKNIKSTQVCARR